ncbi:MAG: hypothetical protein R3260_12140, partial [Pseudomonas sp.]|nr:hypothetical protein [Pseudomonas sp.]
TGLPASACLRMAMIWLSEKRDVFTQNFLDPIRRKFYFRRVLISGGITPGRYAAANERRRS